MTPHRVAAILIEPVQGDGGFLPASPVFLRALRDITQRHGILLIPDEIQTGFGRTGTMFGSSTRASSRTWLPWQRVWRAACRSRR